MSDDLLSAQRAIFTSALTSAEKICLLAILQHWSRAGQNPWPGVTRLVEWTSFGRTAVLTAIAGLEAKGAIVVTRESGRANRYDLSPVFGGSLPVRETDRSGRRTSPGDGRDQSARRTTPVRETDGTSPPGGPEVIQEVIHRRNPKKESISAETREVFQHWTTTLWSRFHDRPPKLTDERRRKIQARLADGYSVEDLKRAIDAVTQSPHHMGSNDQGKPWIELELIFRNPEKVDGWLSRKLAPRTNGRGPVQPNHPGEWSMDAYVENEA